MCPETLVKGSRGNASASKLKADAMKNQTTRTKPDPNTGWADNPQAVEIDALIERAGRLTKGKINALDRARDQIVAMSNWDIALDIDDLDEARDAEADIIWASALDTIRDVECFAVADAALALCIRDLINENTPWNQAAYDFYTGPWAKVVGKVHPDDVGA